MLSQDISCSLISTSHVEPEHAFKHFGDHDFVPISFKKTLLASHSDEAKPLKKAIKCPDPVTIGTHCFWRSVSKWSIASIAAFRFRAVCVVHFFAHLVGTDTLFDFHNSFVLPWLVKSAAEWVAAMVSICNFCRSALLLKLHCLCVWTTIAEFRFHTVSFVHFFYAKEMNNEHSTTSDLFLPRAFKIVCIGDAFQRHGESS